MIVGEEQPKLRNFDMYANTTSSSITLSSSYYLDSGYIVAPSQLTATNNYVYEKEFYGLNGVETGTIQNVENLSNLALKVTVFPK